MFSQATAKGCFSLYPFKSFLSFVEYPNSWLNLTRTDVLFRQDSFRPNVLRPNVRSHRDLNARRNGQEKWAGEMGAFALTSTPFRANQLGLQV